MFKVKTTLTLYKNKDPSRLILESVIVALWSKWIDLVGLVYGRGVVRLRCRKYNCWTTLSVHSFGSTFSYSFLYLVLSYLNQVSMYYRLFFTVVNNLFFLCMK